MITFSPDNLRLATAGDDQEVHTWNADNGTAIETFEGHKGPVFAVAFAGNGTLVSGAVDRSAVIWDLNAGWTLERIIGAGDVSSPISDPFEQTNAKAIVFISIETDCPISNRYAPEIQRLFTKYASQGIDFWLVYPAPERQPAEIERHVKEFQLSLRVLRDPQRALVRRAGVRVTPEAAVFFRDGSVVYRGRIDNKFADFGKERPSPRRRDLDEALLSVLNAKPITNATTLAIGCYIPALP